MDSLAALVPTVNVSGTSSSSSTSSISRLTAGSRLQRRHHRAIHTMRGKGGFDCVCFLFFVVFLFFREKKFGYFDLFSFPY